MMTEKKQDIMGNILSGNDEEFTGKIRELDFLIYRNEDPEALPKKPSVPKMPDFKVSKKNVSVEVWDGKAKIKVKVAKGGRSNISMKKLVGIAVDAIIEELKKEGS